MPRGYRGMFRLRGRSTTKKACNAAETASPKTPQTPKSQATTPVGTVPFIDVIPAKVTVVAITQPVPQAMPAEEVDTIRCTISAHKQMIIAHRAALSKARHVMAEPFWKKEFVSGTFRVEEENLHTLNVGCAIEDVGRFVQCDIPEEMKRINAGKRALTGILQQLRVWHALAYTHGVNEWLPHLAALLEANTTNPTQFNASHGFTSKSVKIIANTPYIQRQSLLRETASTLIYEGQSWLDLCLQACTTYVHEASPHVEKIAIFEAKIELLEHIMKNGG